MRYPRLLRSGGVPGPRGVALLATLKNLRMDPLPCVAGLSREYGDLVRVPAGLYDLHLVSHPKLIQEACESGNLIRGEVAHRARKIIGHSLVVSDGEDWRQRRRLLSPCFGRSFAEHLRSSTQAAADEVVAVWSSNGSGLVDVEPHVRRYTLDSTYRALFVRPVDDAAADLGDALTGVLDLTVQRAREVLPLPVWVPTPRHREWERRTRAAHAILEARLRELQSADPQSCLAARVLHDAGEDGYATAKAELFGLLFGGYESPSRTMTWALSLLARHPEHQERIREALLENSESAKELVDAFLRETLRLFPPAWVTTREATCDMKLGSYEIKKGKTLMFSAWVTHRRADLWEDAEKFRPERFSGQRPSVYKYFPFGFPPHGCIGAAFAMTQASALILRILRSYRLHAWGAAPTPVAEATVRPGDPVKVELEPLGGEVAGRCAEDPLSSRAQRMNPRRALRRLG